MKSLIITLIIMAAIIPISFAQDNWRNKMEKMHADFARNLDQVHKDIANEQEKFRTALDAKQADLQKEMDKMYADLNKELNETNINLAKDIAIHSTNLSRDLAVHNARISKEAIGAQVEVVNNVSAISEAKETKQSQGDIFNKLADIKGVEVVYISKALLGMMPQMNLSGRGVNIKDIAGKLEELQIVSAEQKNAVKTLKSEISKLLKSEKYETIMFVKDDNSKTVFYQKKYDKNKSELLMISEEESEMRIIRFVGNFSVKDIQSIANMNKE